MDSESMDFGLLGNYFQETKVRIENDPRRIFSFEIIN